MAIEQIFTVTVGFQAELQIIIGPAFVKQIIQIHQFLKNPFFQDIFIVDNKIYVYCISDINFLFVMS